MVDLSKTISCPDCSTQLVGCKKVREEGEGGEGEGRGGEEKRCFISLYLCSFFFLDPTTVGYRRNCGEIYHKPSNVLIFEVIFCWPLFFE